MKNCLVWAFDEVLNLMPNSFFAFVNPDPKIVREMKRLVRFCVVDKTMFYFSFAKSWPGRLELLATQIFYFNLLFYLILMMWRLRDWFSLCSVSKLYSKVFHGNFRSVLRFIQIIFCVWKQPLTYHTFVAHYDVDSESSAHCGEKPKISGKPEKLMRDFFRTCRFKKLFRDSKWIDLGLFYWNPTNSILLLQ